MQRLRVSILGTILAVLLAGLSTVAVTTATAPVAQADTPALPATAQADVLPAPQINGVVWKQVIVNNTVYVGGDFQKARPFGSASGVNTVTRNNMLAYNLTTGALDTTFSPSFNAKINDIAVTPDHTQLIVVGTFSSVTMPGKAAVTRNHVAVFNLPADGSPNGIALSTTVVPSINGETTGVAATNSAIFVSGWFSAINGMSRARDGSVSATNGSTLPFYVPVDNNTVQSIVVSADGSQVVLGGNFTSVGGSSNPGFGIYRANSSTGAGLPLPVNSVVYSGGTGAGFQRLASDSTSFYGTAWNYNGTGNTEGVFQASWSDGSLVTLDDCHGDSYDAAPIGDVVYVASHKHYCGDSGGFPQTGTTSNAWVKWQGTAWTKAPMGTNTGPDLYGYPSHPGTPRGQLLSFLPQFVVGNYTGKSQATWDVTGNSDYVLFGGEFLKVDGISQQGIVRFGMKSVSPHKVGPMTQSGKNFTPNAQSYLPGQVHVSWPALWDHDDATLTYQLFRNDTNTKIYETTQTATQWSGQSMSFTDTNQPPGAINRYAVRILDSDNNVVNSSWATVTVSGASTLDPYAATVIGDGASKYWRLDDTTTTTNDMSGADDPVAGTGVGRGTAGALTNTGDTASSFDGTINGEIVSTNLLYAPTTFSEELWFKTTSGAGGVLASYGDASTGDATGSQGLVKADRMIYMDTAGRVSFGVLTSGTSTSGRRIITSPTTYNNGAWHQAVATLGSTGTTLYVDGKAVGTNSAATSTTAISYGGYWRVGGGYTWSGGKYFNGSLDDYSVNPSTLTAAQVLNHYNASGRGTSTNVPPIASFSSSVSGATANVDASASTDIDGTITGYAWDFGDGSPAGSGKTTSHTYTKTGTYPVKLTVTDNKGATTSTTNNVTVTVPNTPPTASFSYTTNVGTVNVDGSGSTDTDGTITGYAWDFGDGSPAGSGKTTSHTYTKTGTYPVKLTVTDDKGGTDSTTQNVSVTLPNVPPTASFSYTTNGTTANVDASGSTDSDGTITGYAWDFGEPSSGTNTASGKTASHQYAAPGTYTVTLTVTDNSNATSTTSKNVMVSAVSFIANDTFNRTATSGWGTADVGGPWTIATGQAAKFAVTPGAGTMLLPPSSTQRALLGSVSSSSATTSTEFTLSTVPTGTGTGDSLYVGVVGRRVGADEYLARLTLDGNGNARLWLLRDSIGMASFALPGTITAGTKYTIAINVTGTNPVTISAKAWPSAGTEPATWQVTKTDTGTTAPTLNLQNPGSVGIWGYVAPGSSNVTSASPLTLTFDSYSVQ